MGCAVVLKFIPFLRVEDSSLWIVLVKLAYAPNRAQKSFGAYLRIILHNIRLLVEKIVKSKMVVPRWRVK